MKTFHKWLNKRQDEAMAGMDAVEDNEYVGKQHPLVGRNVMDRLTQRTGMIAGVAGNIYYVNWADAPDEQAKPVDSRRLTVA